MALQEDENTWILELEAALLDTQTPSASDIYAICKGQAVPTNLRPDVWQACLDVIDRGNQLSQFNEVFDLPEQNIIRDDCQQLVEKLGNDDEDKVSVVSDLESILTFYCKSKGKQYKRGNGWIELLGPLIALKLPRSATYNLFEEIIDFYIPRGETYSSVLRLLLLYHEPELCSFLDTKRVSPDQYTKGWVTTLFAGVCSLPAVCTMWDLYFMQADPFFMLFLSLIMVINAREQILSMKDNDKQSIIDAIAAMPCALEAEDVTDFCSLAQYYAMKTPSSFKQDLYPIMFGDGFDEKCISHVLCLPVSAQELVENSIESPSMANTSVESVKFFSIHEYFGDEVVSSLVDHNSQHCLVCSANISETNSNEASPAKVKNNNSDFFGKIKKVKVKLFDYIVNPSASVHNNIENRNGKDLDFVKRQKKTAPVFSIDDDQELDMTMTNNESEEPIEVVSIQQWMKDPKLLHSFKCQEVKVNGDLCDSILLVTDSHLIVLREIQERKGAAHVIVKRPLTSIVKITSRKRHSDLITFKYGTTQYNDTVISDMDKFLIPNASEATKLITQQILKQLKTSN
ncbi:TBC1 domain family member 23 [Melipona quadrifasciata]|uniref:TBC1 domain family member 23 n=1 Tax=Melipona quadrifasciata TaxID=166423 RepID=A0A0N0BIK2_9HYME|nr:TBC1 domain family member 23 [Melipona quadrifasciata]